MRIDEYRIGAGGGETGQAERAREMNPRSPSGASAESFGRADQVAVSGLAGRVAEVLAASGEERQARIARLTEQFDSGTLDANPARLSRSMISSMMPS